MADRNVRVRVDVEADEGRKLRRTAEDAERLGRVGGEAAPKIDRLEKELDQTARAAPRAGRGMRRMARAAGAATTAVRNLRGVVGALGTALSVLGIGGFISALRGGISTILEFGDAMAKVRAVLGASQEDYDRLVDAAKRMGETTQFTASQSASALEFLARAGNDVNTSISLLPGVLRLAQAGGLELAEAADIATNVLAGFRQEADLAARFIDVLAAAAAKSNTDVRSLGSAMAEVAPVAASANQAVETVAAAIGGLGNAGIKGEKGGNAVKAILASLLAPSAAATKAIQGLGLTLEDLDPTAHSLTEIISRLAEAGLGAGEAFEIFGRRGAPAISALVAQAPGIAELERQLDLAAKTSDRMARIMEATAAGSFRSLGSAIEGVVLKIGEGLNPALRQLGLELTATTRGTSGWEKLGAVIGGFVTSASVTFKVFESRLQRLKGAVKNAVGVIGAGWASLGDLFAEGLDAAGLEGFAEKLRGQAQEARKGFQELAAEGAAEFTAALEEEQAEIQAFLDTLVEGFGGAAVAIEAEARKLAEATSSTATSVPALIKALEGLEPAAFQSQEGLDNAAGALLKFRDFIKEYANELAGAGLDTVLIEQIDRIVEGYVDLGKQAPRALGELAIALREAGAAMAESGSGVDQALAQMVRGMEQRFADAKGVASSGASSIREEFAGLSLQPINLLPPEEVERLRGRLQALVTEVIRTGGEIGPELQALGNAFGLLIPQIEPVTTAAASQAKAAESAASALSGVAGASEEAATKAPDLTKKVDEVKAALEGLADLQVPDLSSQIGGIVSGIGEVTTALERLERQAKRTAAAVERVFETDAGSASSSVSGEVGGSVN